MLATVAVAVDYEVVLAFHENRSILVCPWPQPLPSSLEDTHDNTALVLLSGSSFCMVNLKNGLDDLTDIVAYIELYLPRLECTRE